MWAMSNIKEDGYIDIGDVLYGLFLIGLVGFFVCLFAVSVFGIICPLWAQEQIKITVDEKIPYHNGQYLIIATTDNGNKEVFAVGDEIVLLTFNASDRYATLEEGKEYLVKVCGYRVQLLSWYRNIFVVYDEKGYGL